ncbi:unnamed protein product [Caenorhabditis nigoni]
MSNSTPKSEIYTFSPIREPKNEEIDNDEQSPEYVTIDDEEGEETQSRDHVAQRKSSKSMGNSATAPTLADYHALEKKVLEITGKLETQTEAIDKLTKETQRSRAIVEAIARNFDKSIKDSAGTISECKKIIKEHNDSEARKESEMMKSLMEMCKNRGASEPSAPPPIAQPSPIAELPPPPPPPPVPPVLRQQLPYCVFCETPGHKSRMCRSFATSARRQAQIQVLELCPKCLKPEEHPDSDGKCENEGRMCAFCANSEHHPILCEKYKSPTQPHSRGRSRAPTSRHRDDERCIFCGLKNHDSVDCEKYPTSEVRQKRIQIEQRCPNCLKRAKDPKNHPNCPESRNSCDFCSTDELKIYHHEVLCKKNELVMSKRHRSAAAQRHHPYSTTASSSSSK